MNEAASVRTVVELLGNRAEMQGVQPAFVFLGDGEVETERITFVRLYERALVAAAAARDYCPIGGRAALLFPPGLDFIVAFFGCVLAGVVPVPSTILQPGRRTQSIAKLAGIVADCGASALFTTAAIRNSQAVLASKNEVLRDLACVSITDRDESAGLSAPWAGAEPSSVAFLQYTSGSTSSPKGVVVTHQNLLQNAEMIRVAMGHGPHTRVVGWLPLFHDMGLIGNVFQPVYLGVPSVLMSPVAFVQRPARWLAAISHYRATSSGGPNFGYDLCVRRVTPMQKAAFDLSCWDVAFTGAEPISASTMAEFQRAFASSGFRATSMYPCYGLAECTLFATGKRATAAPQVLLIDAAALGQNQVRGPGAGKSCAVVNCGGPWLDSMVRIVDPATGQLCAEDTIGEIWIAGPHVAQGYWNNPEATGAVFRRRPIGDTSSYLRTGDLGFLRDGELYVTGRIKDLIILAGRNYYPQDIELSVANAHPDIRPGGVAAFGITLAEGVEGVVVLAEIDPAWRDGAGGPDTARIAAEVTTCIRAQVTEDHEIALHDVVLVASGAVAKTSSGKTQRFACRRDYLLNRLSLWPPMVLPHNPSGREERPDAK